MPVLSRKTNNRIHFSVQLSRFYKKQCIGIQDKPFLMPNRVLWTNPSALYILKHIFFFFEQHGRHGGKVALVFFFFFCISLGIKTAVPLNGLRVLIQLAILNTLHRHTDFTTYTHSPIMLFVLNFFMF